MVRDSISLVPIADSEQHEFLEAAEAYFRELNPAFVAQEDWKNHYVAQLRSGQDIYMRWIESRGQCAGFVIFGLEKHRFLPRTSGCVYELYVFPRFRRLGVGETAAKEVIRLLREFSPSKIQLEIALGNTSGVAFWRSLGFKKISERYVLKEGQ